MDQNDPAWRLAEAALAVVRGDFNALDKAFTELKPTTKTLSQAYALCLTTQPFSNTEATRLMLNTMQFALAEKAAHKLNVLTGWLIALTVTLVSFGVFDVVMRLHHGCG